MLVEDLKARGLIELSSAEPERILSVPRNVYFGIDPTGDSLHIGHLSMLLFMKRLGDAGHKLVFLVGGATGMIGDPREKGERSLLDEKTVAHNKRAIKNQIQDIFGRKTSFRMVDNADWLLKLKLIPFLRDIGKHFTVNDLVKRDIIAKRLATPDESISYTEFSYSLFQGYDFVVLNKKYGCDLEVGASDQWTNILSGVDLVRKKEGKEVFALAAPLITDAAGKKFSKSEGTAVWLDPARTSPFRFYQFWINQPDETVEKYLKVYTFMSLADIEALMQKHQAAPQEREAQETLARVVTEIVHGPAAAAAAAAATDALFGGKPFAEFSREEREVAASQASSVTLAKRDLASGASLADALVAGGLATSKTDARRLIEGKSITLNDLLITTPDQKLFVHDLPGGLALVRKGKREVLVLVLK